MMKAPPSAPDLRSVSAFSVYNGLAGGLKSFEDHSSESRQSGKKRKRKKNRKPEDALKMEETKTKAPVNVKPTAPAKSSMEQQLQLNVTAPPPPKAVASTSSSAKTLMSAPMPKKAPLTFSHPSAEITSSKKNKKKRKKDKEGKKTVDSNSKLYSDDDPNDSDVDQDQPPAKTLKMVPNPLASAAAVANSPKKREERKKKKKDKGQNSNEAIASTSAGAQKHSIKTAPLTSVSTPRPSTSATANGTSNRSPPTAFNGTSGKSSAKALKAIAIQSQSPSKPLKGTAVKNPPKPLNGASIKSPTKPLKGTSVKSPSETQKPSFSFINPSRQNVVGTPECPNPTRVDSIQPPDNVKRLFDGSRIENSVEHGRAMLEWLIHPVKSDHFMQEYFEKKPLLIKRKHKDAKDYFNNVLTTQGFDEILRRHSVKYGVNLDVTNYEYGERETISDTLVGRVRPAVVWDYYNNGCSVRMLNPQTYCQPLWRINASLQEFFGSFVGANVYLTPPDSQGFAPHYDDIEAFILQVEGKKQWKVYAPRSKNEKLPRFSSPNFSEENDDLGEPILDEVLEQGDLLYFPRGWIHQAKTVRQEHSFHITLSCHQLNTYGDLLKHHLNHAVDKLLATDTSFRAGLPRDYLSYMGLVHESTKDPFVLAKRQEFSSRIKELVTKIGNVPADAAADSMGKKLIWDSLPPFNTRQERETSVVENGEFMMQGQVFNRVEIGPDTEVKLTRQNCLRLVAEDGQLKLYYSTENPMVYHEQDAQFLDVGLESAPAINYLVSQYPDYCKVEDLPISSDDVSHKIQIVSDLWERNLILTREPLVPYDDGGFDEEEEEEDHKEPRGKDKEDGDDDAESVNLSDLPPESSDEDDDFYNTSMDLMRMETDSSDVVYSDDELSDEDKQSDDDDDDDDDEDHDLEIDEELDEGAEEQTDSDEYDLVLRNPTDDGERKGLLVEDEEDESEGQAEYSPVGYMDSDDDSDDSDDS